jgi:hypothetical protein
VICSVFTDKVELLSRNFVIICSLLTIAAWSCNQPFDPRGPLDQQLVVFCILTTDRDVQYVRVNSNYMPPGLDPYQNTGDNAVRAATVTMISSSSTWTFRDTLLATLDFTKYSPPTFMYYLRSLRPTRGRVYQILVKSPDLGVASGSTVIPTAGIFYYSGSGLGPFTQPFNLAPSSSVTMNISFYNAKGYASHLYLYYDVLKGSQWVEERIEIPESSFSGRMPFDPDSTIAVGLTPTPEGNIASVRYVAGELTSRIKYLTNERYRTTHIFYKWLSLVVLSADQNLSSYYKAVRGFQDPLSLRLDQPMFSNINGGVGFVGSYSLDSITVVLPGNFSGNK